MRILVVSDNHGDDMLSQIHTRESLDHMIHCGDFCMNMDDLPSEGKRTIVSGNCDFAAVPDQAVWEGDGLRFWVTHGHRYQIKTSMLYLSYRAQEVAADVVCFGHTHHPYCAEHEGRLYLNPGSVVQPRGYTVPTYAILKTSPNRHIQVQFFTPTGEAITDLGGAYALKANTP